MALCPCIVNDLDIHPNIPIQVGIEEGHYEECRPNSSIENQDVFEFDISGAGDDYASLSDSFLFVEYVIKKGDGTTPTEGTNVAMINNCLHSAFSQVDVWLNETLVTRNSNLYSYKAYLENVLSHGVEAETSYLTAEGFYKQEAGKFESTEDSSFTKRKTKTDNGKKYQCMGRLHVDLFQQSRAMLNNVNIKIKLVKNKNTFSIFSPSTDNVSYKLKITDIAFYIRKLRISNDLKLKHMNQLNKEPAIYPYKQIVMKSITIPSGISDYTVEKLHDGELPNKIFFGLVENTSFNGNYHKNPFKFDNNGINLIVFYLDGKQIPSDPMTPNYDGGQYVRPYLSLIEATGTLNSPYGINLSYDDFKNDYNIYGMDLTPHLSTGNVVSKRRGSVRLYFRFKSQLSSSLTLITYSEIDTILKIDKARNIVPYTE